MVLDIHEYNLKQGIEEVLNLFQRDAEKKQILISYYIDKQIPLRLNTDKLRLKQVLTNLDSDALKFTYFGEVSLAVKLLEDNGNNLKLAFEVKDTGIGISADKITRLFKPFSQGDPSITRKYGGTGLGLVICERIVEFLGGSINVESILQRGTSIIFSIVFKVENEKRASAADDFQNRTGELSNELALKFPCEYWWLKTT